MTLIGSMLSTFQLILSMWTIMTSQFVEGEEVPAGLRLSVAVSRGVWSPYWAVYTPGCARRPISVPTGGGALPRYW